MGMSVSVGKSHRYTSPVRPDSHPECYFQWYDDVLFLVDFGHGKSHWTCLEAWMKIKGLNYGEAISDLYYTCGSGYIRPKHEKVEKVKDELVITVGECWEDKHEKYWNLRGLSKEERVLGVKTYTFDWGKSKKTWFVSDLCFAYQFGSKYKLYFPERERGKRFLGNLKMNEVWWERRGDELLVLKAHKDFLVAKKHFDYSLTHLQSETMVSPDQLMDWSMYKCKLWFDNDKAGMEMALKCAVSLFTTEVKIIQVPSIKSVRVLIDNPDLQEIIRYMPSNLHSWYVYALSCDSLDNVILPEQYSDEFKDLDDLAVHKKDIKWLFE
jgi:hypothetical protein